MERVKTNFLAIINKSGYNSEANANCGQSLPVRVPKAEHAETQRDNYLQSSGQVDGMGRESLPVATPYAMAMSLIPKCIILSGAKYIN